MRYCAIIFTTGRQYIVMSYVLADPSLGKSFHGSLLIPVIFLYFLIFYQGIQFKWQHDYTVIDEYCFVSCYCLQACFSKPRESNSSK